MSYFLKKGHLTFLFGIFVFSLALANTEPGVPEGKSSRGPTLFVFDPGPKEDFEGKILPRLRNELKRCGKCSIVNQTPYNAEGTFAKTDLLKQLEAVPAEKNTLIVFLWNEKFEKVSEPIAAKVKEMARNGTVVVATAGRPPASHATLTLSRTLWGQIPEVILIGELEAKEKLVPGTFFGPEMLTALRPPDEIFGENRVALTFALRLLPQIDKREPDQWRKFLLEKKAKTRRLWPTLNDFFGRG